jgi:hypothetical protein
MTSIHVTYTPLSISGERAESFSNGPRCYGAGQLVRALPPTSPGRPLDHLLSRTGRWKTQEHGIEYPPREAQTCVIVIGYRCKRRQRDDSSRGRSTGARTPYGACFRAITLSTKYSN